MPPKNGRTFSLTDELDSFVTELVESGQYASASEVVRHGLRLLLEDQRRLLLQKWLVEGQLTDGEAACLPPGVLDAARDKLEDELLKGLASGRGREVTRGLLGDIKERAVARHIKRDKKRA